MHPKYSVVIPVKNGMPYLEWAIESVLAEQSDFLEVVISVDESEDSSSEFAHDIKDERVRVFSPPRNLSMSEHWDFAQSKCKGDWQIFLGQDDLFAIGYLQKWELMVSEAQGASIEAIVARRAYVNWEGVNDHSRPAIQFWGTSGSKVITAKEFVSRALYNQISYHEGPQAYTSSIVKREVLDAIRARNSGRLVSGHPQDAFLAASVLRHSQSFLFFGEPFSFVGTSSRSAGLAVSSSSKELSVDQIMLRENYITSVTDSPVGQGLRANFRHGSNAKYFLDALVATRGTDRVTELDFKLNKLRFDANLLLSGVERRLPEAEVKELLESQLPVIVAKSLAVLIVSKQILMHIVQRIGASLIARLRTNRFGLVRIPGPLSNSDIVSSLSELNKSL